MLKALTFSKLRALYVDNCKLGDDAFYILAHAMKNMTELRGYRLAKLALLKGCTIHG